MDTRAPRAHPAERSIALATRKVVPTNGLVAAGPRRSIPDTRHCPRLSVPMSDPAGDCRDRLRAYPPRRAVGLLLESHSIRGDDDRGGRIRTMWDTRVFAVH
jgi:hypothetical protein